MKDHDRDLLQDNDIGMHVAVVCRREVLEQGGLTYLSARLVFEETFPGARLAVEAWGDVLSATGFLWGLAANELERKELEYRDPEYPVTFAVKAVKAPVEQR